MTTKAAKKRSQIVIAEQLAAQVDMLAGKRGRSNFLPGR
jgi:hypothetical protein